jgi:hypothetical protein
MCSEALLDLRPRKEVKRRLFPPIRRMSHQRDQDFAIGSQGCRLLSSGSLHRPDRVKATHRVVVRTADRLRHEQLRGR